MLLFSPIINDKQFFRLVINVEESALKCRKKFSMKSSRSDVRSVIMLAFTLLEWFNTLIILFGYTVVTSVGMKTLKHVFKTLDAKTGRRDVDGSTACIDLHRLD